ncbi:MAG: polyphosphate polymerase domain-containing protein [Balneolales bacterium]|nr:polyphosphate polymerase domain-containing protein [Balneolales bacterium]
MQDNLQKQRFEFKYHVDEYTALQIREFVSSYLELDAFGATQPNFSYPVHSLYLDSRDYKTYMDTINGERNRFKLRIRYYEAGDNEPVYFEMKRRMNAIILKKRAKIQRASVPAILSGHFARKEDFANYSEDEAESMNDISMYINQLHAQPRVHVSYIREAWMANGTNKIRVTLDRNVRSDAVDELTFKKEMIRPVDVFGDDVILELKFTDRFPDWFKTMVQVFGLRQESAAKYVDGLIHLRDTHQIGLP